MNAMKNLITIIALVLTVGAAFGNNGEKTTKNVDVAVELANLSISTTVDEARINANYANVTVSNATTSNETSITLENTTQSFRLFIYNTEGTDILSIQHVTNGTTAIKSLTAGSYYYKLTAANGDVFAGEFEVIGAAL